MEWFRLYDDIINDPKILRLDETLRWRYTALLCIVSKNAERGYIPDDEDVCLMMRVDQGQWSDTKARLIERGLILENDGKLIINGWFKRQYQSDSGADRVRKCRKLKRNGNVTVTPPDTETESEQIQNTETEQKIETATPSIDEPVNLTPPTDQNVGLLDMESHMWNEGLGKTGETGLTLTKSRREVLRDIRVNPALGIVAFIAACEQMARSPDFPHKSITYFTDKKYEAVNRVDYWKNGGSNGKSKTDKRNHFEARDANKGDGTGWDHLTETFSSQ